MTFRIRATVALAIATAFALGVPALADAATIRVPQDQPTIQAGIDAAVDGDVVLVAPGTYVENIDFRSKDITVTSESGRRETIIDGNRLGPVVRIYADEGDTPVLSGFTIRNGAQEGGVETAGGAPVIEHNLISHNTYCGEGGGVEARFSGALIRNNVISDNHQEGCSGGPGGGGIALLGFGTVRVVGNRIEGNSHGSFGGGITLFSAGTPVLDDNVIRRNTAGNDGGGIWIVNDSDALITNNVITRNSAAGEGGGIYWLVPSGSRGPYVINNTIAGNAAARGSAVLADGFDAAARLVNNILTGAHAAVLYCGGFNDPDPPVIAFNDVFNTSGGPEYGGICADRTGVDGNISADPQFVNAARGNFHLLPTSPAVDAGTNDGVPHRDFDGQRRPIDGDGDGTAIADMGADEFKPRG